MKTVWVTSHLYALNQPNSILGKKTKESKKFLTPASVATGFPRRLNSVSSSIIVLFIRDWRPGIRDLITCSKCWIHAQSIRHAMTTKFTHNLNSHQQQCTKFVKTSRKGVGFCTFESNFPRCSEPILWARCLYSGVLAKYSRSLRRAAIISVFLLISAWDRFTTPTQGNCSLNDLPSKIWK